MADILREVNDLDKKIAELEARKAEIKENLQAGNQSNFTLYKSFLIFFFFIFNKIHL